MKKTLRTILSTIILSLYGFVFVGCSNDSSGTKTNAVAISDHDDHDHDHDGDDHDDHDHEGHDHDADDHDHAEGDHDHAAHGPNGGIMIELGGDAKAEWMLDDEEELVSIWLAKTDKVTKVEMKTTIEGNETTYEFKQTDAPAGPVFGLKSPELSTAVKMGKSVDTKLVITTEGGELTGQVEHHSH